MESIGGKTGEKVYIFHHTLEIGQLHTVTRYIIDNHNNYVFLIAFFDGSVIAYGCFISTVW